MPGNENSGNTTGKRGKPPQRVIRLTLENAQRLRHIMKENDEDVEIAVNIIIRKWLEEREES